MNLLYFHFFLCLQANFCAAAVHSKNGPRKLQPAALENIPQMHFESSPVVLGLR